MDLALWSTSASPAALLWLTLRGRAGAAVYICSAALNLVVGIGLWRLKEARRLALAFVAFNTRSTQLYFLPPFPYSVSSRQQSESSCCTPLRLSMATCLSSGFAFCSCIQPPSSLCSITIAADFSRRRRNSRNCRLRLNKGLFLILCDGYTQTKNGPRFERGPSCLGSLALRELDWRPEGWIAFCPAEQTLGGGLRGLRLGPLCAG